MKLLLADDDPKILSSLNKRLSEASFVVDCAVDANELLYMVRHYKYDVIILELLLPNTSGCGLVQSLKQIAANTSIFILSRCDQINIKVHALESGAADYLTKPFSFSELSARLFNIIRRQTRTADDIAANDIIAFDDLCINTRGHEVTLHGRRLPLSHKEFELLRELARQPGRLFTRTQLAERVWGAHADTQSNIVDATIYRLRQKIGDTQSPRRIDTIRGAGYVFKEYNNTDSAA
jgi:two-component system, OmpR family, copper resistance phosphate regulon response regulator CusR